MPSQTRRQAFCRPSRNVFALAALAIAVVGCGWEKTDSAPEVVERPFQGIELKLVIDADPGAAAAVRRMQGDWSGVTGAKLTIVETDDAAAIPADCDVVVGSPAYLARLAAQGRLRPIEETRLGRPDLGWSDVYEGVRQGDCRFGANVYGLPLGVQTLVVYARQDWLDELKLAPPKTWAEYQQVAEAFAKRPASENQPPMAATLEPLGQGWAGLTLLTRAAAYAKDRGHYSTLFDVEDMHAEIASPPFVRALDELKAAAPRPETFDVLNASPDDVRRAFLDGRCGLALCRPNLREKPSGEAPQGEAGSAPAEAPLVAPDALSIHPVPGAADVYNRSRKAWQPRKADDGARVPLSGVAGRLAAVSAGSKHPEAAFELAAALIGGRWGGAIRRSSDAAGPCRKSDQADAQTWVADPAERRAATQYVDAVGATLTSVDHLDALRIPGRERYLAALDAAVQKAVRGELDSAAALAEAAQEWERITYELGRDKQGAAYRKSVGYE